MMEHEIGAGIFAESSDVHIFHRSFAQLRDHSSPALGVFYDLNGRELDVESFKLLSDLQNNTIPACVHQDHITKYPDIEFAANGIDVIGIHDHTSYMENFLDDFCKVILNSLNKAEKLLNVEADIVSEESLQHLQFAMVRHLKFYGTLSSLRALQKVQTFLQGPAEHPFVVFGPSGAGKTYVMAKAAIDLCR
jgi:hypothetical protein